MFKRSAKYLIRFIKKYFAIIVDLFVLFYLTMVGLNKVMARISILHIFECH